MNSLRSAIEDHFYCEWLADTFPNSAEFEEKIKNDHNVKVLKNAVIVKTALTERGLPLEEVEQRVKQYLKLNFR